MTTTSPYINAKEAKNLQRKTAELQKKEHLPKAMVDLVTHIAAIQLEALSRVRLTEKEPHALPQECMEAMPAADVHLQGAMLLPRAMFPYDFTLVEELVPEVLRCITEQAPELASLAEAVEQGMATGEISLKEACLAVRAMQVIPSAAVAAATEKANQADVTETSYFSAWEKANPMAPGFLRFVVQSAMMPSLVIAGRIAGEKHTNDIAWTHGYCPVCGSLPLMGRIKDEEGIRMHTCSFCAFEFRAPRMDCPFCSVEAPERAEYYVSEDEPGYQIHVCGSCKSYIKLADFRQFDRVYLPLLDDLASLTLDLYARQMGYTRPTLSAWGF